LRAPWDDDAMTTSTAARRALVIDDDPLICEFITTVLSAIGFTVAIEATGEAGLARVKEMSPEIILLDMRLPGMNGLDVLDALGHLPMAFPTVVGMSGAWAEAEKNAIALGAAAFLRKPLSAEMVVRTVEDALGGRLVWIND
jgi:CheY-like chemotaxis protein